MSQQPVWNLRLLVVTELVVEELVDSGAPPALADPHDHRTFQVVDQRGVLVALVIRHLVDADDAKSSHTMALTVTFNAAMQLVRER